jgi:hypothetical protein
VVRREKRYASLGPLSFSIAFTCGLITEPAPGYKVLCGFSFLPYSLSPRRPHSLIHIPAPASTMRFSSILFGLSALCTLPVFARMNQLASRTSNDHPAIARRQHHPRISVLTDICASVDLSVLKTLSILSLLEASASVEAHICLCITAVPIFVKTDPRIKEYVERVGENKATSAVNDMVKPLDRFAS